MTKKEDRLMLVSVLLQQSFDDGYAVGKREGYDEGWHVAMSQKATVAEAKSP